MAVTDPIQTHARRLAHALALRRVQKSEADLLDRITSVTSENTQDQRSENGDRTIIKSRLSIKTVAKEAWDNVLVKLLYLAIAFLAGWLVTRLHLPHWVKEVVQP